MSGNPSRLDEFGLIRRHFAPLAAGQAGAFGLTDDGALIEIGDGERLVVTADTMVAGVHFPVDDPPDQIARKLLRVNLSDLAAMGAEPRNYTLSVVLPPEIDDTWLAAFAAGLATDQKLYGIGLIGGDTVSTTGPLTFSLTAFGTLAGKATLRRNAAVVDDDIYVSGTIGDASLGLAIIQARFDAASDDDRDFLITRFRLPEPRLSLGQSLIGVARAAADVSDGLVADLGHICRASSCSAAIRLNLVPLSGPAERAVTDRQSLHHSLLTGGDDYELVFTAPVAMRGALERISSKCGVSLARIGQCVGAQNETPLVAVLDGAGNRIDLGHGGYRHFKKGQEKGEKGR